MTESTNDGGGNGSGGSLRQFSLQRLYIKDMSFEAPNAPSIFNEAPGDPDVNLNLRNGHTALDGDNHEVVLHLNIHAKVGGLSLFLVELDQAGIFVIKGYGKDELKQLLGTYCPATLFPYAREAISSMVAKGGFPPLVLQPINFDALYAQASNAPPQSES